MIRRTALAAVLGAAAVALSGGGAASAGDKGCSMWTALGDRPHELDFHVHCGGMEVTDIEVRPERPAQVRAVRKDIRLRHPGPGDHFRCWRADRGARCRGEAGSHVKISGALRMRGRRCETRTYISVFGGDDCDDPDNCNAVGHATWRTDPRPSGCS